MLRILMSLSFALPLFVGCGGSDRPKLFPVSGVVKYKGEPLAQGQINFLPEKGRPSAGKIVDGNVKDVTTYEPNDGLPAGKHVITISAISNPGKMEGEHSSLIPVKYADPKASGLTTTIEASKPNKVDLDLTDK